jgi:hypothetical protein
LESDPLEYSSSSAEDSDTGFERYHFGKISLQDLSMPLVPKSGHTLSSALIRVCQIFKNHYCSKKLLAYVVSFVSEILPNDSMWPKTKHFFLKLMEDISPNNEKPKVRYFCSECLVEYGPVNKTECHLCHNTRSAIYLENNIERTVKNMFEKKGLSKLIDDYQDFKTSRQPFLIRDIVDGSLYKKVIKSSDYDICLLQNTDGFPVVGSDKTQIWPNFLVITDIHPNVRSKFIILHSIWYAPVKPEMPVYLKGFVESMEQLSSRGFDWVHPVTRITHTSKLFVIASSVDAQARAPMQNINLYNGEYGCSFCLIPGVRKEVGSGSARTYPFRAQLYPRRSTLNMLENANELRRINESNDADDVNHVLGVRGYSCLGLLKYFDTGESFSPDYLHSGLLGVVKRHLLTILDSKNKDREFYIGNFSEVIDRRIRGIKPPNIVKRLPRGLNLIKFWKASEFRNWILYYALPCLERYWPTRYLEHLTLLVFALHTLLKSEINFEEIEKARLAIIEFCRVYSCLYRECDETFNLHILSHYAEKVKLLGPLWSHSTFIFESANFRLGQIIHGTGTKVAIEIQNTMLIHNFLNILQYLEDVQINSDRHNQCLLLGAPMQMEHLRSDIGEFAKTIPLFDDNHSYEIKFYQRAKKGNTVYTSDFYTRAKRTCSNYVMYNNNGEKIPVRVLCFCKARDKLFFIGNQVQLSQVGKFNNVDCSLTLDHIVSFTETQTMIWSYVSKICFHLIKIENLLCVPPNTHEINM